MPEESTGRAMASDPSLTANSEQIKKQLQDVERRLQEALLSKQHDENARAAYARAGEIAKKIIVAMTAHGLSETWQELKPPLETLKREAEQAKDKKL
jgi:hypothetical protein